MPFMTKWLTSYFAGQNFAWQHFARQHFSGHWPAWLLAIGAVLLFGYRFGFGIVDPGQAEWLLSRQDPATTYISWLFYRSEPWSFPLGQVNGYLAPIGTTVGMTDSLPLLAVPGKALRFLLPENFQYFGMWVLVNYILQALVGYLIVSRFTEHHWLRFIGALFFLFSPIFLIKENHTALSAHWLLLVALWLYLALPGTCNARWFAGRWGVLLAVVCAVHPYLAAMVLALGWAALLRAWWYFRRLSWWQTAGLAGAAPVLMLLVWSLLGYQLGGNLSSEVEDVWGATALNLNGFVNPLNTSRLLPELPVAYVNKFEGYAYLGLGLLVALTLGAVLILFMRVGGDRKRRDNNFSRWSHWPLLGILVLLGLFALRDSPAWGERVLFHYELPGRLQTPVNSFRAAGRFAWPIVYATLTAVLALTARSLNLNRMTPRWQRTILAGLGACCCLQVVDISGILDLRDIYRNLHWESRLRSSQWDIALAEVDRILTYPPFVMSTNFELDFKDLGLLAWQHGLPTSAGYAARLPRDAVVENVAALQEQMLGGQADPRAIYILRTSYFAEKYPGMSQDFLATDLDGFKVCVPKSAAWRPEKVYLVRPVELVEYLRQVGGNTVVFAVKGGYSLQPAARAFLARIGAPLAGYELGGAFVVLIHRGQVLFEQVLGDVIFETSAVAGQTVGPLSLCRELVIMAADEQAGDLVSIEVGGRACSLNTRGLNAVVLNENQDVLEVASFHRDNRDNVGYAYALVPISLLEGR